MDIINNADRSTWYGAIIADSITEARRLKRELKTFSRVGDVASVLSVYPEDQERKMQLIRMRREAISELRIPGEEEKNGIELKRLIKTLRKIQFKLRKEDDAWSTGKKPEEGSIEMAKMLIGKAIEKLNRMGEQAKTPLLRYQERLFEDYRDNFTTLVKSLDPSPIQLEELPKSIKERFIGKSGKYLLQIFPRENIWDREPLDRFLADLRTLNPDVTGLAVQASESARLMKQGYVQGGIYALLTIGFITFVTFKKLKNVLLAMSPLFFGFLWLLGLMEIFDLKFNLANLVILPLIIGIGIDNGVHIVARYQEGDIEDPVSIIFMSTGKAIILSSLTTMVGFGSLMVANHYGIYSLGLLLTLGVGSCLLASTTMLPLLFRFVENRNFTTEVTENTEKS